VRFNRAGMRRQIKPGDKTMSDKQVLQTGEAPASVCKRIVSLREGQVWRKSGPFDWLRVKTIMFPGTPGDDGGLPGVSFDALGKNGKGISGLGWFVPAENEEPVLKWLENTGRYLAS